jgi:hypothetical protein
VFCVALREKFTPDPSAAFPRRIVRLPISCDHNECEEAPYNVELSWPDAVEEAGKWLGSLRLGRVLDGKTIDLTEAAKTLAFEGRFRQMVFEAARRKLKKRGAREVILPPE